MLSSLYYLIVVFYEIFLCEFAISDGCYSIYLLMIYRNRDNKFYIRHLLYSTYFFFISFRFYLVKIISNNLILNRICPLTYRVSGS